MYAVNIRREVHVRMAAPASFSISLQKVIAEALMIVRRASTAVNVTTLKLMLRSCMVGKTARMQR
jgi:hypothetical protein